MRNMVGVIGIIRDSIAACNVLSLVPTHCYGLQLRSPIPSLSPLLCSS